MTNFLLKEKRTYSFDEQWSKICHNQQKLNAWIWQRQ